MVKKVIDYAIREIIFYRFVCNDPNIINTYCGSTLDFTKRKNRHKSHCNNEKSKKNHLLIYKTIRENGGWDNWRMLEIERKIVKDKTEASQREQYWIEYYNSQMNTYNATQDENYRKEYREQNKDKLLQHEKEYREQNIDKIKQYRKKYSEQNPDKIKQYNKKYREQNPDKIKQHSKEYREQNRDKEIQRLKEYYQQNRDKKREYYQRQKERKLMSNEDKNITI